MNRAQMMHEWIQARVAEGRTVYLQTMTRATKITAKHLHMVRVRGEALEIQNGRRWLDYTHTKLSAQ